MVYVSCITFIYILQYVCCNQVALLAIWTNRSLGSSAYHTPGKSLANCIISEKRFCFLLLACETAQINCMSPCFHMRRQKLSLFCYSFKNHTNILEFLSLLTSVRVLLLPAKILLFWNYAKKHSITSLNSTIGLYNSFGIFFLLFSISFLMYANKVLAVRITDTKWANVFVELSMLMHRYGFCFSWADNSSLYPYQRAVQFNPFCVHCFAFVSI